MGFFMSENRAFEGAEYNGLRSFIADEMPLARDQTDALSAGRQEAMVYYSGALPNEEEGQSRFGTTDVHDVILLMLPSLVEMFCAPEPVVEFLAVGSDDVEEADQRTAYVDYLIKNDSDWLLAVIGVLKDGLTKKVGYLKAYYDKTERAELIEYEGLSPDDYLALASDEEVSVVSEAVTRKTMVEVDPYSGASVSSEVPESYDLTVKRVAGADRFVVEAVPPEEVWFEKGVRSLDDRCCYVAHATRRYKAELLAMGYSAEDIAAAGSGSGVGQSSEAGLREATGSAAIDRGFLYVEHYVLYDHDGDGVPERLMVCTIGDDASNIVSVSGCGRIPIASFTPDPEPHTVIGHCPTDYIKSTQKATTQIWRDILDSLGSAVHQRPVVLDGEADMEDVLNVDIGAPIREYVAGAVRYAGPAFVGREAVAVMQQLMDDRESKVGVSKPSAALDPKALQSSTKDAVNAVTSASQGQSKYIARVFADTTLKAIFRVVNELVLRYQSKEKLVRLTGKFVRVDPRTWNSGLDVAVNIGAIAQTKDEKVAVLGMVVQKQEQIMTQLGMDNPVVSVPQYVRAIGRMVKLTGVRDPESYFNVDVTDDDIAAFMEKKAKSGGQPSPEQQMVMIEQQKAVEKARTDSLEIVLRDDRERDKMHLDGMLKAKELELKYGDSVDTGMIAAASERDRDSLRQTTKQTLMQNGPQPQSSS